VAGTLAARILAEMGRTEEAGQIAEAYLARKAAWVVSSIDCDDDSLADDQTVVLLDLAHRGGRLSDEELRARRDELTRSYAACMAPFYRRFLWPTVDAALVASPEQAKEALARLAPLPWLPAPIDLFVGRTFLLGGRPADARPHLERAARHCHAIRQADHIIVAHALLGRALEALGERERACIEYGVVLQHWGQARPRSLTAEDARARAAALGCR
jgi:serine/threonine-protein kinase